MTSAANLTMPTDLSGQWIDRVQVRRGRTTLVLDIRQQRESDLRRAEVTRVDTAREEPS
jgi:hypothetical protein